MELKGFLLCRQETATAPYPESPTESSGCLVSFRDKKCIQYCIPYCDLILWILSSLAILKSYPHAGVHISDNSGHTDSDLKSSHRFLDLSIKQGLLWFWQCFCRNSGGRSGRLWMKAGPTARRRKSFHVSAHRLSFRWITESRSTSPSVTSRHWRRCMLLCIQSQAEEPKIASGTNV